MNVRRTLLVLLALSLVGAAAIALRIWDQRAAIAPASANSASTGDSTRQAYSNYGQAPSGGSAGVSRPVASSPPGAPQQDLRSQVQQLASSKNPSDKFRAYDIVATCHWTREAIREQRLRRPGDPTGPSGKVFSPEQAESDISKFCANLNPDQMQTAFRVTLLDEAARAGVPLAAIRFIEEGPFGDPTALTHRWSDPLVQEWRHRAIDYLLLAAKGGDKAAMLSLINQFGSGGGLVGKIDIESALTYAYALEYTYRSEGSGQVQAAERQTKRIAAKATEAAIERAQENGKAIARNIQMLGSKK